MKRRRNTSSSDSSEDNPCTSSTFGSMYRSKSKMPNERKKPAEVFRKDLISAMKIPDSHHINPDNYYLFTDTWKEEWEKGVQVPANPDTLPQPSVRVMADKKKEVLFVRPRKYIQCSNPETTEPGYINIMELAASVCRYDLDDMDIFWLQELNEDLTAMGYGPVDENLMEKTVEVLERHCHENMNHAIETEEGLGIEYDEDVICDVCRSPDSEEGNDMVFCDKCNICVHQACYGILKVPEGSWLCRSCVLGIYPQCLLCPKKGGAMKSTKTGTKWAHVSCALWIPEVSIACPERMEPITKISHIPPSRWALVCSLCKLKTGACIQVFRKDLISAMKIPDSHHINPDNYYLFTDTWKEEWEKGVQVPANPDTLPQPSVRVMADKKKEVLFVRPRKYIQCSNPETTEPGYINIMELAASVCRYDLDDMDIFWLQELNEDLTAMGYGPVDENLMEKTVEVLERHCHENMNHAIETEEGLGIEYDEDVICDVCRSPDSEEGNDMVFCDKCNICVHQACYGILKVPEGSWLCRSCVLGIYPQCLLCPKKGGAMKSTKTGTKWAHVSCALWIPEVSIACPERMEPITKISHIPPSRWALVCSLCKLKTGACIQCSIKSCITAFHVTCAFEHSLEMKTILDKGDEVKFKSYCLKHSQSRQKLRESEYPLHRASEQSQAKSEKTSLRAQKLRELEEEFYSMVNVEDVATELGLPMLIVDFIYNYWKLKRKSNFNKPLFPPKEEEENVLVQPREESIHTRMRMFMHLRQDLERVRNLCYMISRREKIKLSYNKLQEQIFGLQVKLANEEIAAGLPVTNALENSLFYPPPRITLKLKMPKSATEDGSNSPTEPDQGPLYPDDSSPACNMRSMQVAQDSLEMRMKSYPKHPQESQTDCLLTNPSDDRSEAEDPSPACKPPPPKFYHGQSLGKPLVLQAALHGQSSIGNGKNQPNPKFAKSNGLEGTWSGDVTQKDSSGEMFSDQEPMLSSHLGSQGSLRKSTVEHSSRSFKEASNKWVKITENLQRCVKAAKNINPKEQLWGKQLVRRSAGRAPYQENDGYCPDVELSDSEAESDGNDEKVRVKSESSDRENPPHDSKRDCHGKSKTYPLSHSSMQR